MTDMQDRIERAARLWCAFHGLDPDEDLRECGRSLLALDLPKGKAPRWRTYEPMAAALLRESFPELFDTPTHWIAPMVATREMLGAAGVYFDAVAEDDKPDPPFVLAVVDGVFASMRTAYLNQKDREG